MRKLNFDKKAGEPLIILCLGAHSDDIEIGCGGTLLQLRQLPAALKFYWVVFSAMGNRGEEARKAAELFTVGCDKEIYVKEFRDGFLPYCGASVKDFLKN